MEPERTSSESSRQGSPPVLDYSRLSRPKPRVTFGGQIMKAAVIGTTAIYVDAFDPDPRLPLLYGLLIWSIVIVASFLRYSVRLMPEVPDGPKWRLIVFVLFLFSFVVPVESYHCDHATTYYNACHLGISYSRTGGPCHNPPHNGGSHLIGNWYLDGL